MSTTTNTGTATSPASAPPPSRPDGGSRLPLRILAVGVALLLVGCGAVTVASLLSRATEHRTANYDGVTALDLDVSFESVQIVGASDTTTVSVDRSYTWSFGKPDIRNRRTGDVLAISSSCPFTVGLGCTGHIRLVVPRGIEIRSHGSDGSLTLRHLDGTLDLSTSDGSIHATDLSGQVTLHSSDGSIEATGLRSDEVAVTTSDGSVRLGFEVDPSSVTARSSDGSIEVVVPRDRTAYDVTATTGDGSKLVSVPTDPSSSRRIELHTSDGSIRLLTR